MKKGETVYTVSPFCITFYVLFFINNRVKRLFYNTLAIDSAK